MSTKRLSRTLVEGFRCGSDRREAFKSARSERTTLRTFLRLMQYDVEVFDAVPAPKRRPVRSRSFSKLSAFEAFLDSRVGESWNETFGIICARFSQDLRREVGFYARRCIALSGEHELPCMQAWGWFRYFVDAQGTLRRVRKPKITTATRAVAPKVTVAQILAWLGKRKVGRMGARLVWFVPARDARYVRVVFESYGLHWVPTSGSFTYAEVDPFGGLAYDEPSETRRERTVRESRVPYVQASVFSAGDEAFFYSLSQELQRRLAPARDT